jgi:hypothetical protein
MPRNGAGTYAVVNTFSASTTARASEVNANFDDVGTALTGSLATDGQSVMTGPVKASDGTVSAPSYTFGSDLNSGWYRAGADDFRASAGGVDIFKVTSAGITLLSGSLVGYSAATAGIADNAVTLAKLATQANNTVLANVSGGSAVPTAASVSAIIDSAVSSTQGVILYRSASAWTALSPGTSGQFLKTLGAAANPAWASVPDTLPTQTSNGGKVLTTDGSSASWSGLAVTANASVAAGGTVTFANNMSISGARQAFGPSP